MASIRELAAQLQREGALVGKGIGALLSGKVSVSEANKAANRANLPTAGEFTKAAVLGGAQSITNVARQVPVVGVGAFNLARGQNVEQAFQNAGKVIPRATFAQPSATRVAGEAGGNFALNAGEIGASILMPGAVASIGKAAALSKVPFLAKAGSTLSKVNGIEEAVRSTNQLSAASKIVNLSTLGAVQGASQNFIGTLSSGGNIAEAKQQALTGGLLGATGGALFSGQLKKFGKEVVSELDNMKNAGAARRIVSKYQADLPTSVTETLKTGQKVTRQLFENELTTLKVPVREGLQILKSGRAPKIIPVIKMGALKDGFIEIKVNPFIKAGDNIASWDTNAPEIVQALQEKYMRAGFVGKKAAQDLTEKQKVANEVSMALKGRPEFGTSDVGATKTRGLINSLQRNEGLTQDFKDALSKADNTYNVRSTDLLHLKAKSEVAKDLAGAIKYAESGSSDKHITTATEAIKELTRLSELPENAANKNSLIAEAVRLAGDAASKTTENARAIQALTTLGRETPEGILLFAQRELQKAGEKGLKIPEIPAEKWGEFTKRAEIIQNMADGAEKERAKFFLFQDVQKLVPSTLMEQAVTTWKAGLLTGLKTTGTNVLSNVSNVSLEQVKDVPATLVDNIVSLFTGQRTVTPTVGGRGRGVIKGIKDGWDYFKTGYDPDINLLELDYKKVNFPDTAVGRALEKYTDTVFRALGSQDKAFFESAKYGSLFQQGKVAAMNQRLPKDQWAAFISNFMENPPEQAITNAMADASIATFKQNTKLYSFAKGAKKGLDEIKPGLGDFVIPFAKTPAAYAMQVIRYTPVGLAKTIIENIGKGKFNQREFVQNIGRGLTGTAIAGIGVALAKQGLITGAMPSNEEERALWELEGKKPNSLKVGDSWVSMQPLGVARDALLWGANLQKAKEESGSFSVAAGQVTLGMGKALTDQTFLSGMSSAISALSDPARYGENFVKTTAGSAIPTIVGDVARAIDPYQREQSGALQALQAKIPGARQALPQKLDVLGQPIMGTGVNEIVNPFRPSGREITPEGKALIDLKAAGFDMGQTRLKSSQTVAGKKVSLSQQQLNDLRTATGTNVQQAISQMQSNPAFAQLSQEEQAAAIRNATEKARSVSKLSLALQAGLISQEEFVKAQKNLSKSERLMIATGVNPEILAYEAIKSQFRKQTEGATKLASIKVKKAKVRKGRVRKARIAKLPKYKPVKLKSLSV